MTDADVVIAGGGLAGAAAAIRLAEAGLGVIVVEKSRGPHDKVCGEFLSGEAMAMLAGLGIDIDALGAVPIRHVGISRRGRLARIPLPFPAASLSRRVLDEALLERAAAGGASVLRGRTVRGHERTTRGFRIHLAGGDDLTARDLIVATGKHDLHGHPRPSGRQGDLVGFKMHYRVRPGLDLGDSVDLLRLDGGYAGLQPVGRDRLNLCLLAPMTRLTAGGHDAIVAELLAANPNAAALLEGAAPLFDKPLAIARVPYGFLRREGDAVRHVGDQAAVIPSFTGDGMAIALWTGLAAAADRLAHRPAEAFQPAVAARLGPQIDRATRLSTLLVRPWFQTLAAGAAIAAPALVRAVARATRLPDVSQAH